MITLLTKPMPIAGGYDRCVISALSTPLYLVLSLQPSLPFLPKKLSDPQRQVALTLLPMASTALDGQRYSGQPWTSICQPKSEKLGFVKNGPSSFSEVKKGFTKSGFTLIKETKYDILMAAEWRDKNEGRWILAWLPGRQEPAVISVCKRK